MGENIEFDNKKFKELTDKSKDLMKDYLRRDSNAEVIDFKDFSKTSIALNLIDNMELF